MEYTTPHIKTSILRIPSEMISMSIESEKSSDTELKTIIFPKDLQSLTYYGQSIHSAYYFLFDGIEFPETLHTLNITGYNIFFRLFICNLILPTYLHTLTLRGCEPTSYLDLKFSPYLHTLNLYKVLACNIISKIPPSIRSYRITDCFTGDLDDLPLELEQLTITTINHIPTNLPPNLKRIILLDSKTRDKIAATLTKLPYGCEIVFE